MARFPVEIEADITTVRTAIAEMMKTGATDVGLRNTITIDGQGGGKVISGVRATLPQLREWLVELQRELTSVETDTTKRRPTAFIGVFRKDL